MPRFRYVYILESQNEPKRHYVGMTNDLGARLKKHNAGSVFHTAKFKPWRIKTAVAFSDPTRASLFEHYLKSASGRAFSEKRL